MTEPGIDEIEEHLPEPTPTPEDYDPDVTLEDPTREADPADVQEQNIEVPELIEDEEDELEEPEL